VLVSLVLAVGAAVVMAPSAGAAEPCRDCVGIIGDSLTYQGGAGPQNIRAKFETTVDLRIDGLTGRGIAGPAVKPSSLDVIRGWRAEGFNPRIFIIALGTNNKGATPAVWQREVGKVLAEIGPGHEVHWIGLGFADKTKTQVKEFKDTLDGMAGVKFHDWNAHVHGLPQEGLWMRTDSKGIHMTAAGYDIRNTYYATVLREPVGST
jgi:hypothetical protein